MIFYIYNFHVLLILTIKDQKFVLIKVTCSPFPCLFALNEFQFSPNKTEFVPNETYYNAPNEVHLLNETHFAPNETHYALKMLKMH